LAPRKYQALLLITAIKVIPEIFFLLEKVCIFLCFDGWLWSGNRGLGFFPASS
jgi:hypothetical protein